MISRLGELTALPVYLHISSYATLAMLSLEHPRRYRGIVVLPCRAEFDTRCVLVCADCSRRLFSSGSLLRQCIDLQSLGYQHFVGDR